MPKNKNKIQPISLWPHTKRKRVNKKRSTGYPDIEIVKISGKYNDSNNRIELYNITFDITYLIKDNTIIAFLFNEKAANIDNTEYTEITEYCIPFTGDLKLLSQEKVNELLKNLA